MVWNEVQCHPASGLEGLAAGKCGPVGWMRIGVSGVTTGSKYTLMLLGIQLGSVFFQDFRKCRKGSTRWAKGGSEQWREKVNFVGA